MAQLTGTTVRIGSRDFVVPECTLKTAKRMKRLLRDARDVMAKMEGGVDLDADELLEFGTTVMVELLRRNYPEITADELDDEITVSSVDKVFLAVLKAAGFEAVLPGEAQRPQTSTGTMTAPGMSSTGDSTGGPTAGPGPTSIE